MKRLVALFMAVTATTSCAVPPPIMTRPANVQADGLECVRATLQRLGYMITAGDRSLGFVRAERMRTREDFPTGRLITDALVVNYIRAGTVGDNLDDLIQVKVARVGEHRDITPAPEAIADAEQLLDRCGKL